MVTISVLKDARNLNFGNGDLFIATAVGSLPTLTQYKNARTAGTLAVLGGNIGAIKGTANLHIVREVVAFEIGVPLEVADQTVSREGVTFKCSLAELDLATVKNQLGVADYSTTTAGATQILDEAITLSGTSFKAISKGPVLYTTSTPAATLNPHLTKTDGTVTGASTGWSATATGTGTLTLSAANVDAVGQTATVGGTAAAGQVYSITVGGLYTVSYTAQTGNTNNDIATNLQQAILGTAGTGRVTNGFVTAALTATVTGAVVTVTQNGYLQGYDYIIDDVISSISRVPGHSVTDGMATFLDYYYNRGATETLTGGGRADITQVALRFFHPYKDGRILQATIFKANPVGSVTLPFEEIAYGLTELEFHGIADFTKAIGSHLYEIVRELF